MGEKERRGGPEIKGKRRVTVERGSSGISKEIKGENRGKYAHKNRDGGGGA